MNNVIEFRVQLNTLSGYESYPAGANGERCYPMYLGSVEIGSAPRRAYSTVDGPVTAALAEFNLPTAVAPGEWPTHSDDSHQDALRYAVYGVSP